MDDIVIRRTNDDGTTTHLIKVPLRYAGKDKMLTRVKSDPDFLKEPAIVLPTMSFEIKGMTYNGDRKLNTLNRTVRKHDDPNKMAYQYNNVPYDINFQLQIYVKNAEDGAKIIEQIIPYFAPEWNATLNLIPELGIKKDIPIILNSVSPPEEIFGSDMITRRALIWTLDFTMLAYFYGPIKSDKIIKFVNMDFYFGNPEENSNSDIVSTINVKPGLDANGNPTSNANASVNTNIIEADDDWGLIVTPSGMVIIE